MADLITSRRTPFLLSARFALLLGALAILGCGFRQAFGDTPQGTGNEDHDDVVLLHTYDTSLASEVANAIPVSAARLLPLLPDEYDLIPAAAFGIGGADEGIVVIVNFQGWDPTIDHRGPLKDPSIRIYVTILVGEPPAAAGAGVGAAGALHFYTLAVYTDDGPYAASLRVADLPVEFVPAMIFDRRIDDLSGVGELTVAVPSRVSPFFSVNSALGYAPSGAVDAVFWHNGTRGTAILHFINEPALQGDAISLVYTPPGSAWSELITGGGFGPGPPDPETGFESVIAPSLNFLYPRGSRGRLLLLSNSK